MKSNFITSVEITDSHVKLLQATVSRDTTTITHCEVKEVTQPSDQELSKLLSIMVASAKIRPDNLIGVIPRRFAILRHILLPSHIDSEIEKMISLQVVKQVPYPKEDILLDYIIVNKESSGYAKVLVIAVHREVVGRYLKIFQDAGLNLNKLTLSSAGLLNWYIFQENKNRQKNIHPTVLINIDTHMTEICFCHQDKLLFSRSINSGAKDLTEEHIVAFLEGIGLTLTTYTKENIGEEILRIILISTMNEVDLLKKRLEAEYKLPVVILHPLGNVPQKKDFKLQDSDRFGVSLAVGVGLIVGDLGKSINLIPLEVSDTKATQQRRQEWFKLAMLFILTSILTVSIFAVRAYKHSVHLRQLQKKIDETEPTVNKIKGKMKRLEFINERLNPGTSPIDVIQELYNLTPPEVSFSVLSLDENNSLLLQGVSETGIGVNVFQKNLTSSPLFKNVALQYVTKRKVFKGELTDFKITCQLAVK